MSEPTVTATAGLTIVATDTDRIKLVHYPPADDWIVVHDDDEQTVRLGTMREREVAVDFAKDWLTLRAREQSTPASTPKVSA